MGKPNLTFVVINPTPLTGEIVEVTHGASRVGNVLQCSTLRDLQSRRGGWPSTYI